MIYHIKSTILILLSLPRLQCRVNWPWKKEQMKVAYFTYFTVINKALLSVSVCGLSSFKIDIVKPDDRIWDVKVLLNPGAGSIFFLFSVKMFKKILLLTTQYTGFHYHFRTNIPDSHFTACKSINWEKKGTKKKENLLCSRFLRPGSEDKMCHLLQDKLCTFN